MPIISYCQIIIWNVISSRDTLREKCPCSELFWSVFSGIRTEYREILRISPYSVRMRENVDQNNFEYRRFLRSDKLAVEEWYSS